MKTYFKKGIIAVLLLGALVCTKDIVIKLRGEYPPGRGCVITQQFQQILK